MAEQNNNPSSFSFEDVFKNANVSSETNTEIPTFSFDDVEEKLIAKKDQQPEPLKSVDTTDQRTRKMEAVKGGVISPAERDARAKARGRKRPQERAAKRSSNISATNSDPLLPTIEDDDAFFGGEKVSDFKIKKGKKPISPVKVIIALVLVALLAWGGALGYSAFKAKDAATTVIASINKAKKAVSAKNYDEALEVVDTISENAAILNKEVSGPQWALATFIPVIGDDVSAVRTLADVLDKLSVQVMEPVAAILEEHPVADIITSKGVDGTAVSQLCGVVSETSNLMQECSNKLQKLPTLHIDKLKTRIEPMVTLFEELNSVYQLVADYAPVMSGLLGVDGERTYLIVAQNSAELRASGGFPGAIGALYVDNGSIDMGDFDTPYNLLSDYYPGDYSGPEGTEGMFWNSAYEYPRDAGFDPDFEYCAEVWAAAYEEKTGTAVDGVVSVTPAVVQRVIALTGDVILSDGTVMTGENATEVLQKDIYWTYISESVRSSANNAYTNTLFAEAAQKTFKKLMSGLNLKKMKSFLELVYEAADDREIMACFANDEEQAVVKSMGYTGGVNTDASEPELGVFFSVTYGSKLGWYVDIDTVVSDGTKNEDGSISYDVEVTFSNTMTDEEVASAGRLIAGVHNGDMAPSIHIFAPAGGSISDFECDMPDKIVEAGEEYVDNADELAEWVEGEYKSLQVMYMKMGWLKPGQTITCAFTVTTAKGSAELKVVASPTLTDYR